MSAFAIFLEELLFEGAIRLRPTAEPGNAADVLPVLERAFQIYRQEIAGPLIDFHPQVAISAAALIHLSAWRLLASSSAEDRIEMPGQPRTAAEHLSADMLLRFVPQLLRRARNLTPAEDLVKSLEDTLRRWPLSGVLADVAAAPLVKLDFAGHSGLLLLYAERLAANEKTGWFPDESPAVDYVELVWNELGKDFALIRQTLRTDDNDD